MWHTFKISLLESPKVWQNYRILNIFFAHSTQADGRSCLVSRSLWHLNQSLCVYHKIQPLLSSSYYIFFVILLSLSLHALVLMTNARTQTKYVFSLKLYCRYLYTFILFTTRGTSYLNTDFDFITKFREVSIEHLQRMRLTNWGRLILRISGPVPFGTCIYF